MHYESELCMRVYFYWVAAGCGFAASPLVILWLLLVLSAHLQMPRAQSCPSGCTGCGGYTVDCEGAGFTSFPEFSLVTRQSMTRL